MIYRNLNILLSAPLISFKSPCVTKGIKDLILQDQVAQLTVRDWLPKLKVLRDLLAQLTVRDWLPKLNSRNWLALLNSRDWLTQLTSWVWLD